MGNTLKSAVQWTSVPNNVEDIRIEFTPINKYALSKICHYVINFPTNSPRESLHTFKTPLSWTTTLPIGNFKEGFESRDSIKYQSTAVNDYGNPMVTVNGKTGELNVISFQGLSIVFSIADTNMLSEARACIEANKDPMMSIFGCNFSRLSKSSNEDAFMNLIEHTYSVSQDAGDLKTDTLKNKMFIRMVLQLREFDDSLKNEVIDLMAKETKLSPSEVEQSFQLLKKELGSKPNLASFRLIRWMSPYTFIFDNGCRAPLWRQLYGDISYIEFVTSDDDNVLFITASTEGYFITKRKTLMSSDDSDFDRNGPYYKNLFTLLRDYSPVFAYNADNEIRFEQLEDERVDLRLTIQESQLDQRDDDDVVGDLTLDPSKSAVDGRETVEAHVSVKTKQPQHKTKMNHVIKMLRPVDCKKKRKKTIDNSSGLTQWLAESSTEEEGQGEQEGEGRLEGDGPSEETKYHFLLKPQDLQSYEHWNVLKLFRYIRNGSYNATIVALCSVLDLDLSQETCALSIREAGGCELLVNLLALDNIDCRTAALKIIKSIAYSRPVRQNIINFGGVEVLVGLLHDTNIEVRCLAAQCLGHIATTAKARKTIRQKNGIVKLVGFLDSHISWYDFIMNSGPKYYPALPMQQIVKLKSGPIYVFLRQQWQESLLLALHGCLALSHFANSRRNRKAMQMNGALSFLACLLKSSDVTLLTHVAIIVSEFAKEAGYISSLLSEGMIPNLVRILDINNVQLLTPVCTAFFKASSDPRIREVVRQSGGVVKLTSLLQDEKMTKGDLLVQLTGAIWKLCLTPSNVHAFEQAGIIPALIPFLRTQPDQAIVHAAAAFSEILKVPANRGELHRCGGLAMLLALQVRTNNQLLVHVNYALAQCAQEKDLIGTIVDRDGVRLLWSQLRNSNDDVKASAAWALCPCVSNAPDSAHMVRSFVCGTEVLVNLLKSRNVEVLAATCAAIGSVAADEENLGVLTQYGVVLLLSKLICTNVAKLQGTLAEAIAMCCSFGDNRTAFGDEDVVGHLVKYLASPSLEIHRSTARALYQLSLNPDNCIRMHAMGCVKPLVKLIGSEDHILQEAASKCIANIRRLALANQMAREAASDNPDFRACGNIEF